MTALASVVTVVEAAAQVRVVVVTVIVAAATEVTVRADMAAIAKTGSPTEATAVADEATEVAAKPERQQPCQQRACLSVATTTSSALSEHASSEPAVRASRRPLGQV
jgi:hypothetical protein